MKSVSQTYHLSRRNGVWSYRRRVPTHLIAALGKRVIQFSLRTTNLAEAKKRRAAEDLKWSTRFEAAQKALSGSAGSEPHSVQIARPLPQHEVLRLVQEYVERTDEGTKDRFLRDPPESQQAKAEIKADIEMGIQIVRNADDPRADEIVWSTSKKILRNAGLSEEAVANAAFAEHVRRGVLELDRRKLARLDDDHSRSFFDQQFNPTRQASVTFGDLVAQFLQMTVDEAAANRTSQKWVDKQRAHAALLSEIVGANTPIQEVDYDVCLRVRTLLARIPSNRSKVYNGVAIEDAIGRAEEDGKPRLSSFTQERYLATLRGVLDLAAKKRLIPVNPATDMGPLKRDVIAPSAKRRPFTVDQLKQFFESDFYRKCTEHPAPHKQDKAGWRFWLPLLCLFMGMRPNEACQMHVGDVKTTAKGTWYVDVIASEEEDAEPTLKTLKTSASRRRIPVHPELVAIGFLSFVEERKQQGSESRLFHGLKPDGYGNHAAYALKRFREVYLPKAVTLGPRQSFYSFRHNFRDELRRIDAPPDALQALGGWSQGKLVSDDYGDKSNPDYQSQFIKKMAFPGLDFSHLRTREEIK